MAKIGQGVFGKIRFRDGEMPLYNRTYLIIYTNDSITKLLNVSSTAGKEIKLAYCTNRRIIKYNPPFYKDSFVKLDSCVCINNNNLETLGFLQMEEHLILKNCKILLNVLKIIFNKHLNRTTLYLKESGPY